MLSGEGNAGERWKTTIGLISKKATLHVQHTFLYISLPLFCATTTWNFQKLVSYTFYGGNVIRVLVHFFFTTAHFHLALVAASISHFVAAATKFSCCSSNKKISFVFFSRWASLSFSSIFHICGHDNWSIKLNTLHTTETETISAFRFRRYWLLSCLCFTRRWWLCDFLPK